MDGLTTAGVLVRKYLLNSDVSVPTVVVRTLSVYSTLWPDRSLINHHSAPMGQSLSPSSPGALPNHSITINEPTRRRNSDATMFTDAQGHVHLTHATGMAIGTLAPTNLVDALRRHSISLRSEASGTIRLPWSCSRADLDFAPVRQDDDSEDGHAVFYTPFSGASRRGRSESMRERRRGSAASSLTMDQMVAIMAAIPPGTTELGDQCIPEDDAAAHESAATIKNDIDEEACLEFEMQAMSPPATPLASKKHKDVMLPAECMLDEDDLPPSPQSARKPAAYRIMQRTAALSLPIPNVLALIKALKRPSNTKSDQPSPRKSLIISQPLSFRHVVHVTNEVLQDLKSRHATSKSSSVAPFKPKDAVYTKDKLTHIWEREIIPNWESRRRAKPTLKLWRLGIPHQLRAVVWKMAIGNVLAITPDLFNIFRAHARSAADSLNRRHSGISTESLLSARRRSLELSKLTSLESNTDDAVHAHDEIGATSEASDGSDQTLIPDSSMPTPLSCMSRRTSQASSFASSIKSAPVDFHECSSTGVVDEPSLPDKSSATVTEMTRSRASSRTRKNRARSLRGHESSVALIPIDLPRTISFMDAVETEAQSKGLQRARTYSALPRSGQKTKTTPVTPPRQHALGGAPSDDDGADNGLEQMRDVLEAYVCYRPDIGYVQGMSYLASMLVGTGAGMDTYSMFVCLANMLHQPCLRTFFTMNVELTEPYIVLHKKLIKEHLPELERHFQSIDFSPEMYLYEWILTLYAQILPTNVSYRLWDWYFLYGDCILFSASIAVLKSLLPHLIDRPFEEVATLLTRGMDTIAPLIDEDQFFVHLKAARMRGDRYERLLKLCETDCSRRRAKR